MLEIKGETTKLTTLQNGLPGENSKWTTFSEFLLKGSLFWRHEFFKLDYHYSHCTGSPHFTRFHFARSSLYTRFIFFPNGFTLCNALHDFLTLHCQKTLSELYLSTKGSMFHFTRISLYTIYFEKQKSCKVRATCTSKRLYYCLVKYFMHLP